MDNPRRMTMNEVVAFNVTRWRKVAGLEQKDVGARVGWSDKQISDRIRGTGRRFDAGTLVALAAALGVPVVALLLPPEGAALDTGHGEPITAAALLPYLLPGTTPDGSAAAAGFHAELRRMLDATGTRPPADPLAAEIAARARSLRDAIDAVLPALRAPRSDHEDV